MDQQLRQEVRFITTRLGAIIREQAGAVAFDNVEQLRQLAKAIRAQRDRLDALRNQRDSAEQALKELRASPDARETKFAEIDGRIQMAEREAGEAFDAAHRMWIFKVLAARLSIVIPLWAFAVLLWRRRHQSRYITLLWGYWAFAAWMLLYGVAPYLPHYGGYIPLTLGATTVVAAAISLVRFFWPST